MVILFRTKKFFLEKSELARQDWQRAANNLKLAKDRAGIVTIEGKRSLLMDEIKEIETKLLAGESEWAGGNARVLALQKQIAELPARIEVSSISSPNQVADGMRAEYYKLQSLEQDRSSRMEENHPHMIALRAQMGDLEKIMLEQEPTRTSPTIAINPSRQALELELLKEESMLKSIEARKISLQEQQTEQSKELTKLSRVEIEIASLQHEVDLTEGRFRALQDKRDQAHTNQQLDEDRISNISIVQPASFVSKAHGTSRMLILALGGFLGLTGGIALAWGWDIAVWLMNSQLDTASQIENELGLPHLGTVPVRIPTGRVPRRTEPQTFARV